MTRRASILERWRHPLRAALLFLLVAVPLFLFRPVVYERTDEETIHGPVIAKFAAELPVPGVDDYGAAFGPLYHVALAPLWRAGIHDLRVFAGITLLLSIVGVAVLVRFFERIMPGDDAVVSALIVGWAPHYLGPAIFLASDNPAFIASVLAFGPWIAGAPLRPLATACWSTVACLIRQFNLWMAPIFLLEALRRRRWRLLWPAIAPIVLVGGLVLLWKGLTPPTFAVHRGAPGPGAIIYFAATLGLWSLPLLPAFWVDARGRGGMLVIALVVFASALYIWPVGSGLDSSMWGGTLRSFSKPFGTVAESPALFWLFVPLGAVTLALWLTSVRTSIQRRMLIVLALWLTAQTFNAFTLDKYYQPMTLLAVAIMSAPCTRYARAGRWVLLVFVLLASILRLVIHGHRFLSVWGL